MKRNVYKPITCEGDQKNTTSVNVSRGGEDGDLVVLTQQSGNLHIIVLAPQQAGDLIKALVEITSN